MKSKTFLVIHIVFLLAICFLFFMAFFSFLPTCFSFEQAKEYADLLASDGNFTGFNNMLFITLSKQLRRISVGLLVIAMSLIVFRKMLVKKSSDFVSFLGEYLKNLYSTVKEELINDSKTAFYWLLLFSVGGILVRCFVLYYQPMRCDESTSFIFFINKSWFVSLCWYPLPNNHILNSFLAHISCAMFGNAPWVIRLPAFIAGSLLIPATYITAKRMFDSKAIALLASAFVAGFSPLVDFSAYARGYTLVALLFLVGITVAIDVIKQRSLYAAVILAFLSALGFLTIPVMLFPFGALCLWMTLSMLIFQPREKLYNGIKLILFVGLCTIALTVIFYTPAISISGLKALSSQKRFPSQGAFYVISHLGFLLKSLWDYWSFDLPLFMSYILIGGVVIEIFVNRKISTIRTISLSICVVLWSLFILLLRGVIPYPYMWVALFPVYLIAAAAGLVFILEKFPLKKLKSSINFWGIVSSIFFVVFCYGFLTKESSLWSDIDIGRIGRFRRAESVANFLKTNLGENDIVTGCAPATSPVRYYCFRKGIDQRHFDFTRKNPDNIYVIVKKGRYSLKDVFDVQKVDVKPNAETELVAEFDSALIYKTHNTTTDK